MMRIVNTFILLSLVAIHQSASAQENTDAAEATTQARTDADSGLPQTPISKASQTSSVDTSAKTTAKAAGNYNPTEEISDDLSVSFPVDI